MISIPTDINDMSVFNSSKIVWHYNNETASWDAYSSDPNTNSDLQANGFTIISFLSAGSGIFIEK